MCDTCLENLSTETHKSKYSLNGYFKLCESCAILNGYRTVYWYKENEKMILKEYGIDWRDI